MFKADFFKNLASQISEILPKQLGPLKEDFEKNCQLLLKKTFNKFDLVTREEFDVQTKVLLRTRKRLEELEKQLTEIEKVLKQKKGKNA